MPSLPGASSEQLLEALLSPSEAPCWKRGYRGGCRDIFFLTTLDKTPEFVRTMYSVAEELNYLTSEIGIYIQPQHQGACCHCEFSLPYDPGNPAELAGIKQIFLRASEELFEQGAFFSRPYGAWADMVYRKDGQATATLRKVKKIFDPHGVMNPGKLCC